MKNPVHPGAILREDVLGELGVSVSDAAERLGVSRVTLSRVINEHARISPNSPCVWRPLESALLERG